MPTLHKQLEDSVGQITGPWWRWQLILLPLYPLALIHLIVFLVRFSRVRYLRGELYTFVSLHQMLAFFVYWIEYVIVQGIGAPVSLIELMGSTYLMLYFFITLISGIVFHYVGDIVGYPTIDRWVAYHKLAMMADYAYIQQIAERMGDSLDEVTKAIDYMIANAFLPLVRDAGTGELVMHNGLYDKYREMAMDPYYENVQEIARDMGRWPHEAFRVLQIQIELEGLPLAVDEETGAITRFEESEVEDHSRQLTETPGREPVSIQCPGCGARTFVKRHSEVKCEYCGSVIQA